MKQENIITDSILYVKNELEIGRGYLSIIENNKIIAVDAIGAVICLYEPDNNLRKAKLQFKPGWLDYVCDILDVDRFWLYKFWMGWDVGYQILIEHEKNGKTYYTEDEVAKLGIRLAKEYV